MTCWIAPPGPSAQASGASHCTWRVDVDRAGLHEPPSGMAPSATETVTVTGPGAVHVKLVDAAFGEENEPLGADHVYVIPAAFGADAEAVKATLLPTVVSAGLADEPPATAQLYVSPLKAAEPASGAVAPHCMRTVTFVVVRAVIENGAEEPAHVTRPS